MKLQGRSLERGLHGADVFLLQTELRLLGANIPRSEHQERSFGPGTRQAVLDLQKAQGLPTTGVVDEATAQAINAAVDALRPPATPPQPPAPTPPPPQPSAPPAFTISGRITQADGSPFRALVRGFDRDLRDEELLGEAVADDEGHYEISYDSDDFARSEKRAADLVVRVFDPADAELAASEVLFNAPPEARIDLTVSSPDPALSEYEAVLAELSPVLDDVSLGELTDDDLTFLAGDTGLDRARLELLRQSARLGDQTDLPTEALYGFGRQDLPLDFDQLLARPGTERRAALERAIEQRIAPVALRQTLDQIIQYLDLLASERDGQDGALDAPIAAPADERPTLPTPPADIQLSGELLARGYGDVLDIARAPRSEFVADTHDLLGDFNAGLYHATAWARAGLADSVATGLRVEVANDVATTFDGRGIRETVFGDLLTLTCACADCDAAFSPRAYLADLLDYAVGHVRNGGARIDLQFLESTLRQPFGRLPASCEAQEEQVRQVRLAVEVLRRYLSTNPPSRAAAAQLERAERAYRLTAYTALLEQVGTSYEELRLARLTSAASRPAPAPLRPDRERPSRRALVERRRALAERLGIDLEGDALNALLLDPLAEAGEPHALTEQRLEELFGLPSTTGDPLADSDESSLLRWRLQHLRTLWAEQDQSQAAIADGRPILDPDVVEAADLKTPTPGDPAYDLWSQRRADLQDRLTALRQTARRDGLPEAVQSALDVSVASLTRLSEQQDAGTDISARLRELHLSLEALSQLLRIVELDASGGPVLASEREELLAILIQAEKERDYEQWREEERARDLVLGPDHFKIPDASALPEADEPSPHQVWRAPFDVHRAWQDALRARIDQEEAAIAALHQAIQTVEEAALPALRDDLILATSAAGPDLAAKATWLSDRLLIDFQADGCQITTRISLAIEAVQGMLFAVRTGQLTDTHPALELRADDFDEEWQWIGSYATWRAAMLVFLYPENVLIPSLRRWQTPAFIRLVNDVRGNRRLSPDRACDAARAYAEYLRDVTSLTLEAACQTRTRVRDVDGCQADIPTERALLYIFGRGAATNTAYWSAYDPSDPTGYAQTFWDVVPGLANVQRLIGASAYEQGPDQRAIYLFATVQERGGAKLVYARYDVEQQRWDGETHELELPKDVTYFWAAVYQTSREDQPPRLAIQLPSGAICDRRLNREATGWEGGAPEQSEDDESGSTRSTDEWKPIVGALRAYSFELCAMVEIAPDERCLIVRNTAGRLRYRLFGRRDDGLWRNLFAPAGSEFRGAFNWPGTDHVYVLWGTGASTSYASLEHRSDGFVTKLLREVGQLNRWLLQVARISLNDVGVVGTTVLNLLRRTTQARKRRALAAYYGGGLPAILQQSSVNAAYREMGLQVIDALVAQVERDESEWSNGWRLADELIRQVSPSGVSLGDALKTIFRLQTTPSARETVAVRERPARLPAAIHSAEVGLSRIVPTTGAGDGGFPASQRFAVQHTAGQVGVYQVQLERQGDRLIPRGRTRIAPLPGGPADIPQRGDHDALQQRRWLIEQTFDDNRAGPASTLTYLEEAYYFVPVHLALQLQQRGHYTAALDWLRTVYDYSTVAEDRKISHWLVLDERPSSAFARADDWLLDPLNPHTITTTRRHTYTRFTLATIVRCLLDSADSEFTRDTAESVPRARTLYQTALDLLDAPPIRQTRGVCEEVIGSLDVQVGDQALQPIWDEVRRDLTRVRDPRTLERVVTEIRAVIETDEPWERRLTSARELAARAVATPARRPSFADILSDTPSLRARTHNAVLALPAAARAADRVAATAAFDYRHTVASVAGLAVERLDGEDVRLPWLREPLVFRRSTDGETQPIDARGAVHAPTRAGRLAATLIAQPLTALRATQRNKRRYSPSPLYQFCIPRNPAAIALRQHAETNLHKLRTCRNIAGVERPLEPYAAPTNAATGLPTIGPGGQLVLPSATPLLPTAYRYAVLVERAKQLVSLAQQIESSLLSTLEKREAEAYQILRARQDARLARAQVRLQELRVREAEGGVALAELQQERAQIQADHYKQLIDEGLSDLESEALGLQFGAVGLYYQASVWAAIPNIIAGLANGAIVDFGGIMQNLAQSFSAHSSFLATMASYERRSQEWEYQRSLAQQDIRIGAQQVRNAEDRVRVVGQEQRIAEIQAEHTDAMVDFLSTKFTNVELYDWLSGVLERVYSYFLQQATAMAQLAAIQLAFERQQPLPPFIQSDYWESPADGAILNGGDGRAPDRRGLSGSARLLQDVYQLDQYAFETDRRKLQLSKTISLARLAPAEFQRFRETGLIRFATPMELFDREFPGHYLRLVKRVKTSVIALIPPTHGIRATLSTSGVSRAVIGGQSFQTVVVNRGPESVALSSARDATGLFELEPQSALLLPFEGVGVDTAWELRMPKPANQFDYRTLADVLVTIDYTALDSFDYHQQVLRSMRPTVSEDRPFSFRHQLPDQWYDLHNPRQSDTPMVVRFTTVRDDFPPNLENLQIQHVALAFGGAGRTASTLTVERLLFTPDGAQTAIGGGATPVDGIVSTRRGNAGAWQAMIGTPPFGVWELALPDTEAVRSLFAREQIEDILLVITYSARTAAWPD